MSIVHLVGLLSLLVDVFVRTLFCSFSRLPQHNPILKFSIIRIAPALGQAKNMSYIDGKPEEQGNTMSTTQI